MFFGLSKMELINDYIIVRRPSIPKFWDSIAKPYVALIIDSPLHDSQIRYYLSQAGPLNDRGKEPLITVNIDELALKLQSGALLEIRFNAMKANLFKLEMIGDIPCWRWVGKYRGLKDYDYPSPIDWTNLVDEDQLVTPREVMV